MEKAEIRSEVEQLKKRVGELEETGRQLDEGAASLKLLLSATPIIVVRFSRELRVTFVNRYVPPLNEGSVLGRSIFDFIDPSCHDVARRTVERVLATGEPGEYENVGTGPHGTVAHYQAKVVAIPLPDGTLEGCLAVTDVTSVVQRERAVAQQEEALRRAMAAARMGLFSWDLTSGTVTWDERMREITGLQEPVDLGSYVERLVHPEDRQFVAEEGQRAFEVGFFGRTHRLIRPDGSQRWVVSTGLAQKDAAGRPVRLVGGLLDITAQREFEDRMLQSQRLSAVGTLTTGIAHNFNNLLAVILPNLELLGRVVPESHALLVSDCAGAAQRAADLVRQLMRYAGGQPRRAPTACQVGVLTERVVEMCARTFDRHVQLDCAVEPNVSAMAEPGDVEQVLMNLLLNARDAVLASERGGQRIEVRVARAPCPTVAGGQGVFIRVSDNGVGMDTETLRRARDPFFTTKAEGRGTGLGLTTSHAIARELGGSLELRSVPGQGTTATLWLPVAQTEAPAEKAGEARPRVEALRILIIDDEPLVRTTTARLLEYAGHQVVAVGDDVEARTALSGKAFDVLLLDRSLPGAPGSTLVPRFRALAPKAKILFFTGHSLAPEEATMVDGVIQKPVRLEELLAALTSVTAGSKASPAKSG